MEAMKACAVAVRTSLWAAVRDDPELGRRGKPIPNGPPLGRVAAEATEDAIRATRETEDGVILHTGRLIHAYRVPGAFWPAGATSGEEGYDPSGTERYVTYNEHLWGPKVWLAPYPLAPTDEDNRGCMSDNGADALAARFRHGWADILRFFFGADLHLTIREREDEAGDPLRERRRAAPFAAEPGSCFPFDRFGETGDPGADLRARILANAPKAPPLSWDPLQTPVPLYMWEPLSSYWVRLGDGYGEDRALALALATAAVGKSFPVLYFVFHTSWGTTHVLRAVKNASRVQPEDGVPGEWVPVGGGVVRFWSPDQTFYRRASGPGEVVRFNIGP
jgi:hypothetical protein